MTDPHTLRLHLLANGYDPLPISGKAPHWKNWSEGTITDARLIKIEAAFPDHINTGIRTGRCVAIDIDITDAAHAEEIDKLFSASLGDTLLKRVGAKGFLLCYFNSAPIPKITIGSNDKRLVEILGAGQQFVAYGTHPDTGLPYAWPGDYLGGEPLATPLADLPTVSAEMLREAARQVAAKLTELGYSGVTVSGAVPNEICGPSPATGFPVVASMIEGMLKRIPPSSPREDWLTVCGGLCNAPVNDPTFDSLELFARWSRGDLHEGNVPPNFAGEEDCANEWNRDQQKRANGASVPAFGALVKLARAHGYDGPSNSISAAETFARYADGPVPFRDVLTRTVAPVQEIIPGLIEKGTVTFLSGPGGSNKSRLAVQWGLSVDAGVPIFGRSVECDRFVYVSYEDHADEVARRAQAIARRLSLDLNREGLFWDLCGQNAPLAIVQENGDCETQPYWDKLHHRLKTIPEHKFLVIDSCYNALRFVAAAKINEGAVMAGIGLLQRLCDETNSTLLVLWHPSQAGQERGDASGWSVAWHNAPRARLSLSLVKDVEDAFDLKVEKRNHGPKGKPVTLHWSEGVLLPRAETDTVEQGVQFRRAVVRVAKMSAEHGSPIQQQKRLAKWHIDEIERDIGRRPSEREIKEVLAAALPRGELRYLKGTMRRMAGYYPPDQEQAEEMARTAKRGGGNGDGHA